LKLNFTPKTSPNKTVAGLVTGSVALLIVLLVLGKLTLLSFGLVVLGAVLGDYLESVVKRFAGVKDAGTWLPGFGGLLDRFDSLILLAPLALFIF
jgi:phosphatidate cytidylyltransferase